MRKQTLLICLCFLIFLPQQSILTTSSEEKASTSEDMPRRLKTTRHGEYDIKLPGSRLPSDLGRLSERKEKAPVVIVIMKSRQVRIAQWPINCQRRIYYGTRLDFRKGPGGGNSDRFPAVTN
jgi:hypothetical protein